MYLYSLRRLFIIQKVWDIKTKNKILKKSNFANFKRKMQMKITGEEKRSYKEAAVC